ncbi:MAG: hypothetical protein PHR77_19260 [Kiritimatiellae bacterium]|nr:hypothetical protein [Kiritimatiellia bacterium]MDD5521834.1 hypothetical protein [Kiritimatiellia bacterium]
MTHPGYEIPMKAVIIGLAVIICGMTLLVINPFPSSSDKRVKPAAVKKSGKSVQDQKRESGSYEPVSGLSDSDSIGPGSRSGNRKAGTVSGSNQKADDSVMAAYRAKYDSIHAIRKTKERREALLQFGRELAGKDPVRGLAFIKAMTPDFFRFGFGNSDIMLVCQGFFETTAQLNPNGAITMALDLSRQFHRAGLGTVMTTWARSDLTAAIAYLGKLPPEYANHGIESVFSVWGEKDPGTALAETLKFKDPAMGRMFETAVMSVIDGWANIDPKAAWAYVMNPDDAMKEIFVRKDRYLSMIAAKWAEKDFEAAWQAVQALNKSSGGNSGTAAAGSDSGNQSYRRMLEFMVMRLFETDPDAAGKLFDREKWLAGNPWLSSRNVGRLIDEGSVAEAAEWMAKIPDKKAAFDCARQLAYRMTLSDYDSVFKWASMIQDDYIKAGALSNIAVLQAQRDINRPVDWIYDLPAGYAKERSVAGYVLGYIRKTRDRELEIELRQQMGGTQIDMAWLVQVVERSKIDPQDKNMLMNLVEGRRPQKPLVIQ